MVCVCVFVCVCVCDMRFALIRWPCQQQPAWDTGLYDPGLHFHEHGVCVCVCVCVFVCVCVSSPDHQMNRLIVNINVDHTNHTNNDQGR